MRQHTKTQLSPIRLGILVGLSVVLLAGSASAQTWNFCKPAKETTIESATPQALLMLDRSGSMAWDQNDLWDIARDSIINVVQDLTASDPEQVSFGLGYFGATFWDSGSLNANIVFEAQTGALGPLTHSLTHTGPGGYTPTADAIKRISISNTLSRPAAAGILITDGTPQTQRNDNNIIAQKGFALNEACAMRANGQSLYVVGLGGATDTAFNNKLAAAAGQGCCGQGADETCSQGIGTDPCVDGSVNPHSCYGSYEAYNQTEFSNVLLSIANNISCTFQLDTNGHPGNMAPDYPEAVNVRMRGVNGVLDISHRSQDPQNEGWFFTNQNRNSVTLTEHYCAMVQSGDAEVVETQVSCPCEQEVGESCDVPGPVPRGVCPDGIWACDMGHDRCEPLPAEECPGCSMYDIGALCHVGEGPVRVDEQAEKDPLTERNRCMIGVVECVDFVPSCVQLYNPMPELCDGLDNDCDGKMDNITESWAKEEFRDFNISSDHDNASAACFIRDACVCDLTAMSSHHPVVMTPMDIQAEFEAYLNAWNPMHCECRSGLGR